MNKRKDDFTTMAIKAVNRARVKAYVEAYRFNLKIPIYEDGKIKFIKPKVDKIEIEKFYSNKI